MNSPLILYIETSAAWCSAAVSSGDSMLAEAVSQKPFDHASRLLMLIEQCLQQADIDKKELSAIAVSTGPGSYTGLRIGLSTAKGLATGLNIPLIGVDSLRILAEQAAQQMDYPKDHYWIPMLDARRMEVYTAGYNEKMILDIPPHAWIIDKDNLVTYLNLPGIKVFCGDGAFKLKEIIKPDPTVKILEINPLARGMISSANEAWSNNNFLNLFLTTPKYIKNPNITKPKSHLFR